MKFELSVHAFECSICKKRTILPISRSINGADYIVFHNDETGKEEIKTHSLCRMCRVIADGALKARTGVNIDKILGDEYIYPEKKETKICPICDLGIENCEECKRKMNTATLIIHHVLTHYNERNV